MTESCAQRLGFARSPSKIIVSGISSVKAECTRGSCVVNVQSRLSKHPLQARLHILSNITSLLPTRELLKQLLDDIERLNLADSNSNVPAPVDILFGAEYIWDILSFSTRLDGDGNISAISSIFGWIVT